MINAVGKTILPFNKSDKPSENFIMIIGGRYLYVNGEINAWDLSKENYKECDISFQKKDLLSNNNYIVFQQKNLYGVMNREGEIKVPANYTSEEEALKSGKYK